MEFSWGAFWGTIAFWLVQSIYSIKEGTFTLGQLQRRGIKVNFHGKDNRWQHLPMSFLNNWAVSLGDLVFLTTLNGLVIPCLLQLTSGWYWKYPLSFILAIVATWLLHRIWWKCDENLGHIFINWEKSGGHEKKWMEDISLAGRVHFWFTLLQIMIVLAYIFTPMPQMTVFYVSLLLVGFVILQQAQAVFIQKEHPTWALMIVIAEITVIVIIAIVKLA